MASIEGATAAADVTRSVDCLFSQQTHNGPEVSLIGSAYLVVCHQLDAISRHLIAVCHTRQIC